MTYCLAPQSHVNNLRGDYVAGFLVRDLAGHFSYKYVDITVDNSGAGPNSPAPPTNPPAAGPGAQAGTLAYGSSEGKFSLEYPDAWQALDTGKSQIYFYDPTESSQTFVSKVIDSRKIE